jgi:uncharacterized protein DUF4154
MALLGGSLTGLVRGFGLLLMFGILIATGAWAQAVDEYQVKAAFLYNFARFVEWPPQISTASAEPMAICVLGQEPFARVLQDALAGKSVAERELVVRRISDVSKVGSCRILFVGSSERKRLRTILTGTRACGVLTVGETDSFTSEGGMINFTLEGGRVRFEINLEATEREGLRISSKVLSLARIVKK